MRTAFQDAFEYVGQHKKFAYLQHHKPKDRLVLKKFEARGNVPDEALRAYLIFQLAYWEGLDTRCGKEIPVWVIFGEKAERRWKNSRSDYWSKKFCAKYGFEQKEKEVFVAADDAREQLMEKERSKMFNTEEGFMLCQEYAKKSSASVFCSRCKFAASCEV
jgi:hypothetical protein